MHTRYFTLELLSDVSISRSSRTLGGHETLHYLPGATLKGSVAAILYPTETDAAAFRRFHSGQVRFHDALPLIDNRPTWPMPLALHTPKVGGTQPVSNLSLLPRPSGVQFEQCRSGFLDAGARHKKLMTRYSMRTALENGMAKEGFLFGMESLRAGERFAGRIDFDDPTDIPLFEKTLTGKEIRLGRSRTAEYGRAKFQWVQALEELPSASASALALPGMVFLLCRSDLALRQTLTGIPSLLPEAIHFGLPTTWQFSDSRSFLRTRRYSPFNGTRKRHDLERQVITAGSVICFEGKEAFDIQKLKDICAKGVGDYREDGLGQMVVHPELLSKETLHLSVPSVSEVVLSDPPGELFAWVTMQQELHQTEENSRNLAEKWLKDWQKRVVPAAQWGTLRGIARRLRRQKGVDVAILDTELRQQLCQGVATLPDRWGKHGKYIFESITKDSSELKLRLAALERCCSEIVRIQRSHRPER